MQPARVEGSAENKCAAHPAPVYLLQDVKAALISQGVLAGDGAVRAHHEGAAAQLALAAGGQAHLQGTRGRESMRRMWRLVVPGVAREGWKRAAARSAHLPRSPPPCRRSCSAKCWLPAKTHLNAAVLLDLVGRRHQARVACQLQRGATAAASQQAQAMCRSAAAGHCFCVYTAPPCTTLHRRALASTSNAVGRRAPTPGPATHTLNTSAAGLPPCRAAAAARPSPAS